MDQISNIIQNHADKLFDDPLSPSLDLTETTAQQTHPAENTLDVNQIKRTIYGIKDQLDAVVRMLDGKQPERTLATTATTAQTLATGEQILEGVFNGEKMIGPDGKEYAVPPNYASKSKLVEGDMMKLTITNAGAFIFKQIGPIPRKRLIGTLAFDQTTQRWSVDVNGKPYKVLTASISFYKGKPTDEVVILVPEDGQSDWGAVENIISK